MRSRSVILVLALCAAAGCNDGTKTVFLSGGTGCGDGSAVLAASAFGPTLIDTSGGSGGDGGDAGQIEFFADDIRIGQTSARAPRTPPARGTPDLTIGTEDWDTADGDPADLDPDPDTIRTRGDIFVEGTMTVDGDENLESGEGSIFIDGAILRNDDPGEDDGAEGVLDDDDDGELNVSAEDGDVVVTGTIGLSGDDGGEDFGADGGSVAFVMQLFMLADAGIIDASGGDGGDGGSIRVEAANDAITRSGALVAPAEDGYAIDFRGLLSVQGGAGADGADAGDIFVRAWEPGAIPTVVLAAQVIAAGGDGADGQGGNGGDVRILGTHVDLAGEFLFAGGDGSGGDGGNGGKLVVGGGQKACLIQVAGGATDTDDVDFALAGGTAAAEGGEGGRGGAVAILAVARDLFTDADIAAAGGAGDFGGDGGGVLFASDHGNIENTGSIDVSGADGSDGAGGDAGSLFEDPDESDDPLETSVNSVGIFLIALDGSITNGGTLTGVGGDSTNAGGAGGDGGDVLFLVDDRDPEDEAGDPDGLGNAAGVDGVELLDNNGGDIVNTADIFTDGGDAGGTPLVEGGDAGDVTMDADPNNDEDSGPGAGASSNTGAISAAGGDAAGSDGPPMTVQVVRLDIAIISTSGGPPFAAGTEIEMSKITNGNVVSMEPGCASYILHLHAIGPSGSPRSIFIDLHEYPEPLGVHPNCGIGEVLTVLKSSGNAAGGDGGDVLLRTAGDFTDDGTITQLHGTDIGTPADPSLNGETTVD